jgi:hypothetical protein
LSVDEFFWSKFREGDELRSSFEAALELFKCEKALPLEPRRTPLREDSSSNGLKYLNELLSESINVDKTKILFKTFQLVGFLICLIFRKNYLFALLGDENPELLNDAG